MSLGAFHVVHAFLKADFEVWDWFTEWRDTSHNDFKDSVLKVNLQFICVLVLYNGTVETPRGITVAQEISS